jgi:L-lactate dehydrogenase complex protein LldG
MAMNFLCDRLVVLLRAADVLPNLEDMWARVRQSFGNNTPRALSLVSGPSSSGDIGMQFATGVHGPIELHVLVVDS